MVDPKGRGGFFFPSFDAQGLFPASCAQGDCLLLVILRGG